MAVVGAVTDGDKGDRSGSAYVFDLNCPTDCPADLDANGSVGFSDMLAILAAWGPCPGCPEDVDGNGAVAFADILIVLAAWGPCG